MCAAISSSWETLVVSQKYERNKCIPFRLRMYRLNGFVRPIRSRFLSTSQNFESTKLNHGGIPQNKIPHWEDENVNIGYVPHNHIGSRINSFSLVLWPVDQMSEHSDSRNKPRKMRPHDEPGFKLWITQNGERLKCTKNLNLLFHIVNVRFSSQKITLVIIFHSERRFHNGSVGDLCLITVDGEFKRALYVGQTKVDNHIFMVFTQ